MSTIVMSTIPSIIREVRKFFAQVRVFDFRTPSAKLLDRVLNDAASAVKDYLEMFDKLERGVSRSKSDADVRKALQGFRRRREEGLLERRRLSAELKQLVKTAKLHWVHNLSRSVLQLFDATELQAVSPRNGSLTLGKLVLAEPKADLRPANRALLRKRIEEKREFIEDRFKEILQRYYEARHALWRGSACPVNLRRVMGRGGQRVSSGRGKRKRGAGGKSKAGRKRRAQRTGSTRLENY